VNWQARVYVTLKPTVNDPQGLAVRDGLRQLGYQGVQEVRVGKYLEVRLRAESQEAAERAVREMCQRLLANPVVEDFRFEVAPADQDDA
jgi:phosphoribosylformylglycinamidine synthase